MNDDTHQRLEALLDREIEAARALASLLAEERNALTGVSPQSVVESAARKTELVAAIEQLEGERCELAVAAGQPLPSSRMPRHAEGRAAPGESLDGTIAMRWRTLVEVLKDCRASNEVNGYIINTRRHQILKLLGVIRGSASALTYNPQGKAFAKSQRALAKA